MTTTIRAASRPGSTAAAGAVLCCGQVGARLGLVAIACAVFVVARVVYILAYLADKATLRSSMWAIGMLCISALFALALGAL